MKSSIVLILCFGIQLCSSTSQVLELYNFNSTTPTKVNNVQDGSFLYLAASDKVVVLDRITITSNGQTKKLGDLLNNFDANGYSNGYPVNSDLTISTTNTADATDNLSGILFISSPDMAKDPNFLVYVVSDKIQVVDRWNSAETTLVLLNKKAAIANTDPVGKPLYNSRVVGIEQAKTTKLYAYRGTPTDGYTDPSFKDTSFKMIFTNPLTLFPTGNAERDTAFFDNIEPIQFTLRSWHLRAIGGGIKFSVSQEWQDQSTYQTTKETTTGYTMSQKTNDNSTVNYKYTPNHDAMVGFMVTTADMITDMNVTSCNGVDCYRENFSSKMPVIADFFQAKRNDTALYLDHTKTDNGIFYLQYFRIEGAVSVPTNSTTSSIISTTPGAPETTTKSVATSSTILVLIVSFIINLI